MPDFYTTYGRGLPHKLAADAAAAEARGHAPPASQLAALLHSEVRFGSVLFG